MEEDGLFRSRDDAKGWWRVASVAENALLKGASGVVGMLLIVGGGVVLCRARAIDDSGCCPVLSVVCVESGFAHRCRRE